MGLGIKMPGFCSSASHRHDFSLLLTIFPQIPYPKPPLTRVKSHPRDDAGCFKNKSPIFTTMLTVRMSTPLLHVLKPGQRGWGNLLWHCPKVAELEFKSPNSISKPEYCISTRVLSLAWRRHRLRVEKTFLGFPPRLLGRLPGLFSPLAFVALVTLTHGVSCGPAHPTPSSRPGAQWRLATPLRSSGEGGWRTPGGPGPETRPPPLACAFYIKYEALCSVLDENIFVTTKCKKTMKWQSLYDWKSCIINNWIQLVLCASEWTVNGLVMFGYLCSKREA